MTLQELIDKATFIGRQITSCEIPVVYQGVSDNITSLELSNSCDYVEKPADKVEPFDKYEGLTDFERTLADTCIGWIGEELGWKQYIKDNADVLLKIAVEKFNSVQDVPFEQKPAWSEEDDKMLHTIIADFKGFSHSNTSTLESHFNECITWLKSLKPQNRWKPTKQQLSELRCVISGCSFETSVLVELEKNLKKLL